LGEELPPFCYVRLEEGLVLLVGQNALLGLFDEFQNVLKEKEIKTRFGFTFVE
jgi:hypothetical protein